MKAMILLRMLINYYFMFSEEYDETLSLLWPLTAVSVPYIIFEAFNMGFFKDLFFNSTEGTLLYC